MTEKEKLVIPCLFCGTENDEQSLYCKNCGQQLRKEITSTITVNNLPKVSHDTKNNKVAITDSEKYISMIIIAGILVTTISTCLDVYYASDLSRDTAALCFLCFGVIAFLSACYSQLRIKDFRIDCAVGCIVLFVGCCFRPELMSSDVWLQDYYVWYVVGVVVYCIPWKFTINIFEKLLKEIVNIQPENYANFEENLKSGDFLKGNHFDGGKD